MMQFKICKIFTQDKINIKIDKINKCVNLHVTRVVVFWSEVLLFTNDGI